MTQNNLGNALVERSASGESGTARLEEAVAAYRARAEGADPRAQCRSTGR